MEEPPGQKSTDGREKVGGPLKKYRKISSCWKFVSIIPHVRTVYYYIILYCIFKFYGTLDWRINIHI